MLYVANVDEEQIAATSARWRSVFALAARDRGQRRDRHLRQDRGRTRRAERRGGAWFRGELGIDRSGLDQIVLALRVLGLMTFLTAGEIEVRAWTIERGTKAPQAAGKIHSDIERGFIRAEIVSYDDYARLRTMEAIAPRASPQRGQGVRDARGRRGQLPLQRLAESASTTRSGVRGA
jgi:ribosome-binding ATPase YchF (GTP1/OBG family)